MVTTEDVYTHHEEAVENQELEEVMKDYAEDSVLVTNVDRGVLRGPDEIKGLFADLFAVTPENPEPRVHDVIIEGDFVYLVIQADMPGTDNELFWTDTFYIPNETIDFQTWAINMPIID